MVHDGLSYALVFLEPTPALLFDAFEGGPRDGFYRIFAGVTVSSKGVECKDRVMENLVEGADAVISCVAPIVFIGFVVISVGGLKLS